MKTRNLVWAGKGETAILLALIALLLATTVALAAAAGALDPIFDGDGKVVTDIGNNDRVYGMAIQSDAKIVVAGYSDNLGEYNFALARYYPNGSLDATFDYDGKVVTDIRDADYGYAIAIQDDGKIVVAGESYTGGNRDFSLARYNSDGSLDSTFDFDGKVVTDIGGSDTAYAVTIQSDGKIVAAGTSNNLGEYNFALARYNVNGSFDSTFDYDGKVITDIRDADDGFAIAIQGDGRIIVAGTSVTNQALDFSLARYNSNGSLDATFDYDGKVITDIRGEDNLGAAIAIQSDGKIIVAGSTVTMSNSDFALVRYNSNGSPDASFDGDGIAFTDFEAYDYGGAVVVQNNGKIVVGGNSDRWGGNDFALTRYNANGSIDVSFDGDGRVLTSINATDFIRSLAIQSDGKIIAAGTSDDNFALARYIAVPQADSVFLTYSIGAQDGWILESNEFSEVGGTMNSTFATLRLGDDAARRQYRSILSFDTSSSLPDNAVITKVTLNLRQQAIVGGGNPITMFQGFMVDVRNGIFGTSVLQPTDWQAAAGKTVGPFTPSLSGGWYTLNLTGAKAYVNKIATGGGLTQIRLRFKLDDNNDTAANYLSMYSGDAAVASRPQLIIEYYVP